MIRLVVATVLAAMAGAVSAQARLVGDLPRKESKPLVTLPGIETEYGQVRTSEGARLRTIVTRPAGTRGKLPALMLIQWVSCGSTEFSSTSQNEMRFIAERSGMVFIRVERAGDGDSEGTPCAQMDYDTELRHYREAFDQISRHAWIDPNRIFLWGSSLGSTMAPLVAQGKPVAGLAVQGGGAVTYLERMISFDRIYLERSGKYSPAQIHAEMNRRIPFHVEYLVNGKTPEQIERERPDLKGVWASIRGGAEAPPHYGRPYAWHQQAAKKNFLEAWANIQAPVLVIYGEYDQFETRHGHELIASTVNKLRPGSATFTEIPQADHSIDIYANADDAYADRNGKRGRELLAQTIIDWVRRVTER